MKFSENTTVIIGANAIGKTSIIEAINLLASGDSFRAGKVEEMIDFESELARVKGIILDEESSKDVPENRNYSSENKLADTENKISGSDKENQDSSGELKVNLKPVVSDEVEVILTRGTVNGRRTQHRLFSVNGVRRRKKDATCKFYTVVFRPEDMRMIEGSPGRRRVFLDTALSLLYSEYEVALKNYDQTLKRRNRLLQQVNEQRQPKSVLQYWDLNLVKYGEILQRHRQSFLESFEVVEFPINFSVEYDPSIISKERIEQYKEREILVGHTLIGPHKDDIIVYLNSWKGLPTQEVDTSSGKTVGLGGRKPHDDNIHISANRFSTDNSDSRDKKSSLQGRNRKLRLDAFGSRGQQRLGVLWLKFCELEYLKNHSHTKTLLLLDDILSELDDDSKALALQVLKNYQSVVTTTEPAVLEDIQRAMDTIKVIYL